MSQHKTNQSTWTEEDRNLYWERRRRGLSGTIRPITVHQVVKDEAGNDQRLPVGHQVGSQLSRAKQPSARAQKREEWKQWRRQQRKGNSRGE